MDNLDVLKVSVRSMLGLLFEPHEPYGPLSFLLTGYPSHPIFRFLLPDAWRALSKSYNKGSIRFARFENKTEGDLKRFVVSKKQNLAEEDNDEYDLRPSAKGNGRNAE